MKAVITKVNDHDLLYDALTFVCPGCIDIYVGSAGLHSLPVNSKTKSPSWEWDGNLELPTLSPSILTKYWICAYGNAATCFEKKPCENCKLDSSKTRKVCHSFLKTGVFDFLSDCTHRLATQKVLIPDLPTWAENQ